MKNTDTAKEKGYDAGKNVSGIKRHIMVDTQGLHHAIWITTSDVTDRTGALKCIHHNSKKLREIKVVLADGAYCGINFASAAVKKIKADAVIAKRPELHTFKVIPKRWVAARSFAWLEKCRRLWGNCEGYLTTLSGLLSCARVTVLYPTKDERPVMMMTFPLKNTL